MKVNLQKIIILIAVLSIIIPILNISVFAESSVDTDTFTPEDYLISMSQIIDDYANGKISFDEFNEQADSLVDKYTSDNATFDSEATKKVYALINSTLAIQEKVKVTTRDKVKDIWDSICGKNNVPSDTISSPITDLGGYGAVYYNGWEAYVCDYIIVDNSAPDSNSGVRIGRFNNNDDSWVIRYYIRNGKWTKDGNRYGRGYHSGFSFSDGQLIEKNNGQIIKLYGDVRYINGEQYPTDDEFEYGTIKKFDDMPEDDLEDLLNDFSNEMELQSPDLSTIEGLLKAIYARLGTLDSDDDNELLSSILAAFEAFNNSNDEEAFSENLKKIYEDLTIDENSQSEHYNSIKTLLLKKFSFIDNIKDFVKYCFEQYSKTSENPEFQIEYNNNSYSINFSAFNDFMPTIRWIIAAFIYLSFAYHTYRKIPSYINGGDNE